MTQSTICPITSASPAISRGASRSFAEMTEHQRLSALEALDLSRAIRSILFAIPCVVATTGPFLAVQVHSAVGLATMVLGLGAMPLSLVVVPRMTVGFLRSELQSRALDPAAAIELSRRFRGINLRSTRQRKAASQLEFLGGAQEFES